MSLTYKNGARVLGLGFDADPNVEDQEATYQITAHVTQSDGESYPSSATFQYSWSDEGTSSPGVFFDNLISYSSSGTNVVNATARTPGLFLPTCTVVVQYAGQSFIAQRAEECAAIGGPITISLVPPSTNYSTTYNHDLNDPTQPWYLTYLGYSHAGLGTKGGGGLPSTTQATQDATLVTLAQPSSQGTAVMFGTLPNTYMGHLTVLHTGQTVQSQCVVSAEAAFQNETPTAQFTFNDGTISGTASDDSATTQDPVKDKDGNITGWVAHVYALSGHAPGSLVDANDPGEGSTAIPQPPGATYWTDYYTYRYVLQDSFGQPMPGVWVQERFTDGNPIPLKVNQTATDWWPTVLMSALDTGNTTALNPLDGAFGYVNLDDNGRPRIYDALYYQWPGDTATMLTTTHAYYAGSNDATGNATTGVPLGVYTITFTPGAQPNTIGTARQKQ